MYKTIDYIAVGIMTLVMAGAAWAGAPGPEPAPVKPVYKGLPQVAPKKVQVKAPKVQIAAPKAQVAVVRNWYVQGHGGASWLKDTQTSINGEAVNGLEGIPSSFRLKADRGYHYGGAIGRKWGRFAAEVEFTRAMNDVSKDFSFSHSYNKCFSECRKESMDGTAVVVGQLDQYRFFVNGVYTHPLGPLSLFAGIGGGAVLLKANDIRLSATYAGMTQSLGTYSDSQWAPGAQAFIGASVPVGSGVELFGQGGFVYVATSDFDVEGVSVDIGPLKTWEARAGVRFRF